MLSSYSSKKCAIKALLIASIPSFVLAGTPNPADYPLLEAAPGNSAWTKAVGVDPKPPGDVYDWKDDIIACQCSDSPGLGCSQGSQCQGYVLCGRMQVLQFQDILLRAYQEGHQIALHSWSHQNLPSITWTLQSLRLSLRKGFAEVLGVTPTYFRPTYGANSESTREMLKKLGMSSKRCQDSLNAIMRAVLDTSPCLCRSVLESPPYSNKSGKFLLSFQAVVVACQPLPRTFPCCTFSLLHLLLLHLLLLHTFPCCTFPCCTSPVDTTSAVAPSPAAPSPVAPSPVAPSPAAPAPATGFLPPPRPLYPHLNPGKILCFHQIAGSRTRSGCRECIYLAPRGVLNGEADLDQRWLDGTVEHESMGTRHDNRALAARLY
ncbi:hypothetical protein BASA83_005916 [Batrachochytrium salamandrivorans]|nr:hypothetical protein BASA83_005916 [Batrachochytrium salamandrivorans]